MKIIKNEHTIRCDIGRCMNTAKFSIVPNNVDKCSYINVCDACLKDLIKSIKEIDKKESENKKTSNNSIHIKRSKSYKAKKTSSKVKK